MKLAILVAGLAISAAAAAPDAATAKPGRDGQQCFWSRNISNFAADSDNVVNVRVGVKEVYRFELLGPCPDVDWTQRLGIEAKGSKWICSGLDADLIVPTAIGPRRCAVRHIRKLTPAEISALPKRGRP